MSNFGFADGMFIGMERSRSAVERGEKGMVFDWDKAARRIVETGVQDASAGLHSDWDCTGGEIWRDGNPVPQEDTYTYLASMWAYPELALEDQVEDCWIPADQTEWDSGTYWPASALAIIEAAQSTSNEPPAQG